MPHSCSAYGCTNNKDKLSCLKKNITFHVFPLHDKRRLRLWLIKMRRKDFTPNKYSYLCSEHFNEDDFEYKGIKKRKFLKKDAVPENFIYNISEWKQKEISNSAKSPIVCHVKRNTCEKSVQTDTAYADELLIEIKKLKHKNAELHHILEASKSCANNDSSPRNSPERDTAPTIEKYLEWKKSKQNERDLKNQNSHSPKKPGKIRFILKIFGKVDEKETSNEITEPICFEEEDMLSEKSVQTEECFIDIDELQSEIEELKEESALLHQMTESIDNSSSEGAYFWKSKINNKFHCKICSYTTGIATNMRYHTRKHTKEKPFVCEICSKGFSQKASLIAHCRCHTGEKPFACQHCEKSFTRNENLKVHISRYHSRGFVS